MRDRARPHLAFLTVLLVLPLASSPASGGPGGAGHRHGPADPHMRRMAELREELRARLGDAYDEAIPPATPEELELGRRIYAERCAACHGPTGKGDGPAGRGLNPPPADFTDPMHAWFYSDRARIEIIRTGSPGTAMPGWAGTLSDAEIRAVYQVVRSFRPERGSETGHHAGARMARRDGHHMATNAPASPPRATVEGLTVEALVPDHGVPANERLKLRLRFTRPGGLPRIRRVTVTARMRGMDHSLPAKRALPQREAGVYMVGVEFPMAGGWELVVAAQVDGRPWSATLPLEVYPRTTGEGGVHRGY